MELIYFSSKLPYVFIYIHIKTQIFVSGHHLLGVTKKVKECGGRE